MWLFVALNIFSYLLGSALAIPVVICVFVTGAAVSVAMTVKGVLAQGATNAISSAKYHFTVFITWLVPENKRKRKEKDERTAYLSCGGQEAKKKKHRKSNKKGASTKKQKIMSRKHVSRHIPARKESRYEKTIYQSSGGKHLKSDRRKAKLMRERPVTRCIPERQGSREQWKEKYGLETEVEMTPVKSEVETRGTPPLSSRKLVIIIFCTHTLVIFFWTYPLLLILLILFAIWAILTRFFNLWLKERLSPYLSDIQSRVCSSRHLFFPTPLPTLLNAFLFLDQMALQTALSSVSSLMSAFIITILLVGGLALTLFLTLQIRVELTHYVTMTAAIWNRTVSSNPQLME